LSYRAKELGCSLVLYGHTHYAEIIEDDGLTLVNPGAIHSPVAGTPSYAYVVIQGDKVTAKIVDIY
jgi:putative phosphoesterase